MKFSTLSISITILLISSLLSNAQETKNKPLGALIYFEGKVEIKKDTTWSPASINQKVYEYNVVRTGHDATVEIRWNNGIKSAMGPKSQQHITELYNSIDTETVKQTQSIWEDFKNLFVSNNEEGEQEEGGIRRSKVEAETTAAPNEVYWKKMEKVEYETAADAYQKENYLEAVQLLQAFLDQKHESDRYPYALFALAHSYVELNNLNKAQTIFQELVSRYPGDKLAEKAEEFLMVINDK